MGGWDKMSFKSVTDKIFFVDKDMVKNATIFSFLMIFIGIASMFPFEFNFEAVMEEVGKIDFNNLIIVCTAFLSVALFFKKIRLNGLSELVGTMPFICILSHLGVLLVGLPKEMSENVNSGMFIVIGYLTLILTLSPLLSICLFRGKGSGDKPDEKEETTYYKEF